jgi:predicted component of type VI protein secretion system
MKAELVPLNGDPPIPITRDVTILGRREYCDVVIAQASLSKRHCVLVRTDGLLMLRDLATTNGTKVNGQRVSWAALLPNDRLNIGGYKVRVYLGPDDAPSPSEQRPHQNGSHAARRAAPDAVAPPDDEDALGFAAPTPPDGTPDGDAPPPAFPVPLPPRERKVAVEEDEDPAVADIFAKIRLAAEDRILDLD